MSILEDFLIKMNGKYTSEPLIKSHTPEGLRTSQIARGSLDYKEYRFDFWINETGIDPLRIKAQLNEPLDSNISIYPRGYWGKVFSGLKPNWKFSFSNKIHQQYSFSGDSRIIQNIRDNQNLLDLMDGANICISTNSNTQNSINLTPAHGVESVEQLERLTEILHLVLKSIEKLRTTN